MTGYDWNKENIKAHSVFRSALAALKNPVMEPWNIHMYWKHNLSLKTTWAIDNHASTKFDLIAL